MGLIMRRPGRRACWSCHGEADNASDYCYGCGHIVCMVCSRKYDHFGHGHEHGRKRIRKVKVTRWR